MYQVNKIVVSPKATKETIARAFAKAQAQGMNYHLNLHIDSEGNVWAGVTNTKTIARYIVETRHIFEECITCDCPEYGHSFFCKHCALVIDEVQIREQAAIEEEKAMWQGAENDRYAFA